MHRYIHVGGGGGRDFKFCHKFLWQNLVQLKRTFILTPVMINHLVLGVIKNLKKGCCAMGLRVPTTQWPCAGGGYARPHIVRMQFYLLSEVVGTGRWNFTSFVVQCFVLIDTLKFSGVMMVDYTRDPCTGEKGSGGLPTVNLFLHPECWSSQSDLSWYFYGHHTLVTLLLRLSVLLSNSCNLLAVLLVPTTTTHWLHCCWGCLCYWASAATS